MAQMCGELCVGSCMEELFVGAVFHSYLVSLIGFIHGLTDSQTKCSLCYSVACSSIAEVVLVVQSNQTP